MIVSSASFKYGCYDCSLIVKRDRFKNISIEVWDFNRNIFLSKLTSDIPYPTDRIKLNHLAGKFFAQLEEIIFIARDGSIRLQPRWCKMV